MKPRSDFECAVRALRQECGDLPASILVINMDACAAALCAKDERGGYSVRRGMQLRAGSPSPISLYNAMMSRLPGADALNENEIGRAWRRYILSGRKNDAQCGNVACSALESAFAPVKRLYEELFAQADGLMNEETGVALFGEMAQRSLAVHAVRDHFSVDPFLPDPLFIPAQNPQLLVQTGRELFAADISDDKPPRRHRVELLLTNREGNPQRMILAASDTMKASEFTEPFCSAAGDVLTLNVDNQPVQMKIPARMFGDDALRMLSAGLIAEGSRMLLHLRSGGDECRIPIDVKN